ncbi:MAG: hypothetical protein WA989_07720 [Henriciella sp.]|uniref:hypothetical protein n=1 Tax=Henriciella sp. TaxID=1968823 RepID=UPI003C763195
MQGGNIDDLESVLLMMEGRPEDAVAMLEQAFENGHRSMGFIMNPVFEPLRDTPRYVALQEMLASAINSERSKLGLEPIEMPKPYR